MKGHAGIVAEPHAALPCSAQTDAIASAPTAGDQDVSGDEVQQEAAERVRQLIESPSYRQADEDRAFLLRPEMCGVRLQLDFWKTEEILRRHGIEHTIVVYGSTRLIEPAAAQQRLDAARQALADAPLNPQCRRAAAIAERLLAKSAYYSIAREFGRRSDARVPQAHRSNSRSSPAAARASWRPPIAARSNPAHRASA